MATVREEQDEVVKCLVVTLLANSKNLNDVAELGVDILERAPQGRHAFRAIQLPPTHLAKHNGRGHLLLHEPPRPAGDREIAGVEDTRESGRCWSRHSGRRQVLDGVTQRRDVLLVADDSRKVLDNIKKRGARVALLLDEGVLPCCAEDQQAERGEKKV